MEDENALIADVLIIAILLLFMLSNQVVVSDNGFLAIVTNFGCPKQDMMA
jgi:hypothetical protein